MGIAFRCVEKQIADAGTRNMLVLGRYICEDDSRCNFAANPTQGRLSEILFAKIRKSEEPEDSFRNARENTQPSSECSRLDLWCPPYVNTERKGSGFV